MNAGDYRYVVMLHEWVRIGTHFACNIGPFETLDEAEAFVETTKTWAIPPKKVSVHSMMCFGK
jgi:hypothetical protein